MNSKITKKDTSTDLDTLLELFKYLMIHHSGSCLFLNDFFIKVKKSEVLLYIDGEYLSDYYIYYNPTVSNQSIIFSDDGNSDRQQYLNGMYALNSEPEECTDEIRFALSTYFGDIEVYDKYSIGVQHPYTLFIDDFKNPKRDFREIINQIQHKLTILENYT